MAKTKKQGENSACSALFEHAYYSSGYGMSVNSMSIRIKLRPNSVPEYWTQAYRACALLNLHYDQL